MQELQYEPPEENSPPDFRFLFQGVNFDLQVKRLHNVKNEDTKRLFTLECRKHLTSKPQPWFINFSVSDGFTTKDLNPFFSYIKQSLKNFSPVRTWETLLGEPQYSWPTEDTPFVTFSFFEKENGKPGMYPGIIRLMGTGSSSMEEIDINSFRKGVDRLLKKSRKSLKRPVSSTQSNLLVMQAVHPILSADKNLPLALYDSDGLFRCGNFSNISGLVSVPSTSCCLDERFKGRYFPNPMHHQNVLSNRNLFDGMDLNSYTFKMEKYVKWRDTSYRTRPQTESSESWVPQATADLIEGNISNSHEILLPNADHEAIKKGELIYLTREQAKAKAYALVTSFAWENWGIPEERIQEY